jgi:FemAB-related protein (PEP-CTERM system-associated)
VIAAGVVSPPARVLDVQDEASRRACEAYVASHPDACAYHHPGWLDVIHRAFAHETRYLAAESEGRLVGVLPLVLFQSRLFGRFGVSVPFVNYGGVVSDTPEAAALLLRRAVEHSQRIGGTHVELRHTRQMFRQLPARQHKVAMRLELRRTVDQQWAALDRKVRNQVRKGEKSGLDITVGGAELLDGFYGVFARNMRDLGTPVYGHSFFREVLSVFPDRSAVFVATLKGQPAAASIVHWHRDVIEVPWASSIRDFNPLCANVLLYWRMLSFAIERGFRVFDFGRSTPGEGTFLFKQQWGAVPLPLVWEYAIAEGRPLPDMSPHNPKFSLAIRAWQRLPLRVAATLGPAIVRNIP